MTVPVDVEQGEKREVVAQAEPGAAVMAATIVPAHLLDGGEVVIFAIKPSGWYVLLTSLRWVMIGLALAVLANSRFAPGGSRWYLWHLGIWIAVIRLGWAILEWVSRLYVLTNRRVMRIYGVFNVELFECALDRVQNIYVTLSVGERLTHTGTISFQTAGGPGGEASWRIVSRPLEVHEKLREAIERTHRRNGNGL